MMTCREVYGFLDDFLDGQFDALVRVKFEAHLLMCRKCRAYLATYRAALQAARGAEHGDDPVMENVPEELIRAIVASRATAALRPLPE